MENYTTDRMCNKQLAGHGEGRSLAVVPMREVKRIPHTTISTLECVGLFLQATRQGDTLPLLSALIFPSRVLNRDIKKANASHLPCKKEKKKKTKTMIKLNDTPIHHLHTRMTYLFFSTLISFTE